MDGIQRFLTRRGEKFKRSEKNDKDIQNSLRSLFSTSTQLDKDGEKKLKSLEKRIAAVGIPKFNVEHLRCALLSKYAGGDEDKAFELLRTLEDSIAGILYEYNPSTKLLGAENRCNVTCYLDAVLFAMFARLDSFEGILYKSFEDLPRQKLVTILRLWVNLLRSGKLITTDIMEQLQDSLAECGWPDAALIQQQDASEAFTFITGVLELPLLTLKMDIYHTGKEDASDDHKFVNERLLEVAIPPDHPDGSPLTLEECLEAYFNNKIEVKRYMERRATMGSMRSADSMSKGGAIHVETVEVGSSTSSPVRTASPQLDGTITMSPVSETMSPVGHVRRPSIVQQRFIPDDETGSAGRQSRKGSYRKEVMMPAWQFFSLIPWYTHNTPTNDAQVAQHFSQRRPILGICLKRYSVLPNGNAIRLNTYVDIPTEIGLPHFIQDDRMDENAALYGNFKLLLQAIVCHRGNSVSSGHYIALVRGAEDASNPDGAQWMRFDDLAPERVKHVDIEKALREESPYLLFYQIVPLDEDGDKGQGNRSSFTEADDTDGPGSVRLSTIASSGDGGGLSQTSSVRPSLEFPRPGSRGSTQNATISERRGSSGGGMLQALNSSTTFSYYSSSPGALLERATTTTTTPRRTQSEIRPYHTQDPSSSTQKEKGKNPRKGSNSTMSEGSESETRLTAALSRLGRRRTRKRLDGRRKKKKKKTNEEEEEEEEEDAGSSTPTPTRFTSEQKFHEGLLSPPASTPTPPLSSSSSSSSSTDTDTRQHPPRRSKDKRTHRHSRSRDRDRDRDRSRSKKRHDTTTRKNPERECLVM